MVKPEQYHTRLLQLNELHDKLVQPTTLIEAQSNLRQLWKIDEKLAQLEKQIKEDIAETEAIYEEKSKKMGRGGLVAKLFGTQEPGEVAQDKQRRFFLAKEKRVEQYEAEIAFAQSIRTVANEITRPKLQAYIAEREADKKEGGVEPGRVNYYKYIRSPEWKKKAEEAKAKSGNRCQVCNKSRAEAQLDAHHRTYERLGHERPEDITVLCRSCHELYEKEGKVPKAPHHCRTCGKEFIPPKPTHKQCLDCYTKQAKKRAANKKKETKTTSSARKQTNCESCGKLFTPRFKGYKLCYACYKKQK